MDLNIAMSCAVFQITRVLAAIYQEKGSRYRFSGERHAGIYEIFCLDRGRAYVRCDGRRFLAAPGDCILYPPGAFHQHQATKGHAPHYITVAFGARGGRLLAPLLGRRFVLTPPLRTLLARVVAESPEPLFRASVPHRLSRRGVARKTSVKTLPGADAYQRALLTEFLVEWLRLVESNKSNATSGEGLETYREHAGADAVGKALNFVREHFAEPVSLEAAARAAGVSPPHLRHLVQRRLGRSLREELRRTRIQQARHLLSHSNRNVKEVAAAVGYENLAAFSRAFRAVEGLAPSAYARTVGARAPQIRITP